MRPAEEWAIACRAPKMVSGLIAVVEVRRQDSLQVPGVQNDEMVQAVPSYRADQAFSVPILPRTLRRREDFFHAHRRDAQTNVAAVDAVPISNEISTPFSIGERLHDLIWTVGAVKKSVSTVWLRWLRRNLHETRQSVSAGLILPDDQASDRVPGALFLRFSCEPESACRRAGSCARTCRSLETSAVAA